MSIIYAGVTKTMKAIRKAADEVRIVDGFEVYRSKPAETVKYAPMQPVAVEHVEAGTVWQRFVYPNGTTSHWIAVLTQEGEFGDMYSLTTNGLTPIAALNAVYLAYVDGRCRGDAEGSHRWRQAYFADGRTAH